MFSLGDLSHFSATEISKSGGIGKHINDGVHIARTGPVIAVRKNNARRFFRAVACRMRWKSRDMEDLLGNGCD